MNNYQITIVEPTAIRLLEEMARKNLIKLSPIDPKERFKALLSRLRIGTTPSLEEIAKEVESVRTARNIRKNED